MSNSFLTQARKLRVYQRRNLKFDVVAALVVFLVAIPLCLGIAMASGAPLFSGVVSGIIGGLVVGSLSNSQVSVSGPAAGMAAVVLVAISQLGSFEAFLLALLLAGLLQILIGVLRAGFIADYVPSNIIQGLLCAIGILLIIKQLPLAFTFSASLPELKLHLQETTTEGINLAPLRSLAFQINRGAAVLSLTSFAILIYFSKTQVTWLKAIPGPIVVVVVSVFLNEYFVLNDSYLAQGLSQLVNIPSHHHFSDFFSQFQTPSWSSWSNPAIYLHAVIIAIVASLESLLNVKAGEKLDKKRRYCSKDQELIAQGSGNLLAGLLGGIPVTSVIVRTSVNIQAGSKTKMSTILHGLFILLAVAFLPQFLNKIPLSALAAILIYTGYKLSSPSVYKSIYQQGADRFIPFIVTVIGIVSLNLLGGILIGLFVSLFFILKTNSQTRLDIIKEIYPNGVTHRLLLPQQTTFLNKAPLITELAAIPKNAQLIIDARYSDYIDKEIIELLQEFQQETAAQKNISLNLIGFQEHYEIHNYIDFINVTTYDVQSVLSPEQVLEILREGNHRFINDTRIQRSLKIDIEHTARTQHPMAVVLTCIDSRVPVETIFDMSFGDLFCIRIAGNVVNTDILGSIEYACDIAGAKLIVVLGHTRCGAIQAACNNAQGEHLSSLLSKIKPAIEVEVKTIDDRSSKNPHFVQRITELNIANTLASLYHGSNTLRQLTDKNQIGMVGAIYDVQTGTVDFQDFSQSVLLFDKQQERNFSKKLRQLIQSIY